MTKLLEMKGITKVFPGVVANDHINFEVEKGEIHALLGENGAGKTTLMNILYGLYIMNSGEIFINGKKVNIHTPSDAIKEGIGMVHQEFMLAPPFTVVENIALRIDGTKNPFIKLKPVEEKIRKISSQHGLLVNPLEKIENLPVGIQQRVEIVKHLCRDAHLLILDEPTGVLTPAETRHLFDVLRSLVKEGRSIIVITHKLNEVMEISDRVTVLRSGKNIITKRTKDTNIRELARMMVGREVFLEVKKEHIKPGASILDVNDLFAIDNQGKKVLNGVSFSIYEHEILGLAGVSGNGQDELADVLAGLLNSQNGTIGLIGQDVTNSSTADRYKKGMSFVHCDRRGVATVQTLDIKMNSILGQVDNFAMMRGWLNQQKIQKFTKKLVKDFDVRTPGINILASKLSGGNLQKLILGRELMRSPKLLIADQPTRGLDVGATEYVHQKLIQARAEGAGVLLISTELEEVLSLSDRIAVIYEGKIMAILNSRDANREVVGLLMAGIHPNKIKDLRKEKNVLKE